MTKTALGIDVESTMPSASIGYDRVEGFIGPRFENGTVPRVAGSFLTTGKMLNREVKPVYATGAAAKNVTSNSTSTADGESYRGAYKTMFFETSTVLGVKVGFAATERWPRLLRQIFMEDKCNPAG